MTGETSAAANRATPGRVYATAVVLLTVLLMALTFLTRAYAHRLQWSDSISAAITVLIVAFFWRGSRIAKWLAVVMYGVAGLLLLAYGITYGSPWSASWSFLYFATVACLLQPSVREFQALQRAKRSSPPAQ